MKTNAHLPLLVTGALTGLALLTGCSSAEHGRAAHPDGAPKQVAVAMVSRSSAASHDELMGSVTARNRAIIETKVQARVERIPILLGSKVRKGDLLAELDVREFSARVKQAKAIYDQTQLELTRMDSLHQRKLISQQEYDNITARASVAEATLSEAEAMLSYARIVAPFSGVVTQRMIDLGDLAVPGRPLFTVEEDAPPRFVVTLPESRLGSVEVGDTVRIVIPSADTVVSGRVEEVSPNADPVSRTFEIKVDLPRSERIRPGQFGRLLLSSYEDASLFVPRQAVVRRGQLELVYVVTAEHKVILRMVRTGRVLPDQIEILSGLEAGETVVTGGLTGLVDGDPVETTL